MTKERFSKFIQGVECRYNPSFTELFAMMDLGDLYNFFQLVTSDLFDDGGLDCVMMDGYLAVNLIPIAEYYGIDIESIIPKTQENR